LHRALLSQSQRRERGRRGRGSGRLRKSQS
jgi:hypothetical protein